MEKLKMQSPWITHYEKIRELFKNDPSIKVTWDDNTATVNMYIDNPKKAEALAKYMPAKKVFGNVTMNINIIPSNGKCDSYYWTDNPMEIIFDNNPIFHFIKSFSEIFVNPITYVVFAKEVIQFYNDNLGDLYGNTSCLAADLARDVFENDDGFFYCTDIE